MPQIVREIMTPEPITVQATMPLIQVSQIMRDANVGAVIGLSGDQICGIVTDRDIVVRAIASGRDPSRAVVGDICSRDVASLAPSDTVDAAMRLMREKSVRRLPVMEDDRPVGIVSLGDLALELEQGSALAQISAAPANN